MCVLTDSAKLLPRFRLINMWESVDSGGGQEGVFAIADACLPSLKAVACSAFADHGELLQGGGGDHPEEVWAVFQDAESGGSKVRFMFMSQTTESDDKV